MIINLFDMTIKGYAMSVGRNAAGKKKYYVKVK